MGASVLVVDHDRTAAEQTVAGLHSLACKVEVVASAADALTRLEAQAFDFALTDLQLQTVAGETLCEALRQRFPAVVPIAMTDAAGFDAAVSALRAGAFDLLVKPVEIGALRAVLQRAEQRTRLGRAGPGAFGQAPAPAPPIEAIVGESPPMRELISLIHQVAEGGASVLVTGESGTGKELVARALHRLSSRRAQPFVAINCAAVPEALLESELFGHAEGAFTGANSAHDGLFVQASGGTLFLDEIGEMPLQMQVKLLRALQERVVRPVGADHEFAFDTRIVAATNCELELAISEHRFRQDLYYRINVVSIEVPPLRDRGTDVLLLAEHFIETFNAQLGKRVEGLSTEATRKLLDYDWPGNVRELESCMERAVVLAQQAEIGVAELPPQLRDYRSERLELSAEAPSELITLAELEARYIRHVLAVMNGNKSQTARILGLDRRSLYRRLKD